MREELDEVERAYQQQRSELLTGHRAEWESTMSTRRSKELEYLEHLLKRVEDYENQLHQLRVQDAEEYNATKIRLENEVQVRAALVCAIEFLSQRFYSIVNVRKCQWNDAACAEVPAGAAADEGHVSAESGEARVQLPDPQEARRGEHRHKVAPEAQNHQTARQSQQSPPEARQTGKAIQVRSYSNAITYMVYVERMYTYTYTVCI